MNNNNYVAIMAGGIGSRFWPMSRASYPKQFLDILNTGRTLLQATYDRFISFIPNNNIYIVTANEYVSLVQKQLPMLPKENIIGEPERKNTAACIALISLKLHKQNPLANLIVAPSDHLIKDTASFAQNCNEALDYTKVNNSFVTLGIKPTHANTGYGYIQYINEYTNNNIFSVKRFAEKPNKETATSFIKDGTYLWNAGIFIWKTNDILNAFKMHMPKMYDLFIKKIKSFNTNEEAIAIDAIYSECEAISIDYAILEKANNIKVIPATFDWSDLGTWNSAWENIQQDENDNAVAGNNTIMVDANGCMVHSSDKKLVLIGGVDNLIVVNTPDAILVCKKENEQQIKEYVAKLKEIKGEVYL